MNWRRIIVVALSGLGAVLLVAGAFVREPVVVAVGLICSFAGVAMLALMLSRQISWLASELGGARGYIVDKMLTLGAQMKAHGNALAGQDAAVTSLRAQLVEHDQESRGDLRKRLDHLEAVTNELVAVISGEIRALRGDVAAASATQTASLMSMREPLEERLAALASHANVNAEHIEKLQGSMDTLLPLQGEIRTDVAAGVDFVAKAYTNIEALRSLMIDTHQADKKGLLAFIGDEKKLRKVSQLSMQWLKTEILKEIEALSQLRTLLHVEGATPLLGGWAMDAAAMHFLIGVVRERRPLRIVELGSGSSTIWLALALRSIGRGRIVSFDHLELYGQRTRQAIHDQGLGEFAEVRVRELVPVEIEGKHFKWYDIVDTDALGPIDILLVDGPPGATGPMARFPAVPILWPQLADDALIIVDDAGRPDERQMLTAWREAFPDLEEPEEIGARTMLIRHRSTRSDRAKK